MSSSRGVLVGCGPSSKVMAIYLPETKTCENGTPAQLVKSELNAMSGLRGTGPSATGSGSGSGLALALALARALDEVVPEEVPEAWELSGAATAQLLSVAASNMKPRR